MSARRLAPLLLAALALPGCTQAPQGFPTVLPAQERLCPSGAFWQDPALYAALPDAARSVGAVATLSTSLMPGMPFGHADLDAIHPAYDLTSVQWQSPDGPMVWLSQGLPGEYAISVQTTFDDPRLVPTLGGFLEGIGLADSPERPAWERALANSPRDHWPPQVRLVAEPDFEGLYGSRRGAWNDTARGPGGLQLVAEGWTLGFDLPVWRVEIDGLQLWTDARGLVHANAMLPPEADPWPTLRTRVEAAYGRMGLAPPTWSELGFPRLVGTC